MIHDEIDDVIDRMTQRQRAAVAARSAPWGIPAKRTAIDPPEPPLRPYELRFRWPPHDALDVVEAVGLVALGVVEIEDNMLHLSLRLTDRGGAIWARLQPRGPIA